MTTQPFSGVARTCRIHGHYDALRYSDCPECFPKQITVTKGDEAMTNPPSPKTTEREQLSERELRTLIKCCEDAVAGYRRYLPKTANPNLWSMINYADVLAYHLKQRLDREPAAPSGLIEREAIDHVCDLLRVFHRNASPEPRRSELWSASAAIVSEVKSRLQAEAKPEPAASVPVTKDDVMQLLTEHAREIREYEDTVTIRRGQFADAIMTLLASQAPRPEGMGEIEEIAKRHAEAVEFGKGKVTVHAARLWAENIGIDAHRDRATLLAFIRRQQGKEGR